MAPERFFLMRNEQEFNFLLQVKKSVFFWYIINQNNV